MTFCTPVANTNAPSHIQAIPSMSPLFTYSYPRTNFPRPRINDRISSPPLVAVKRNEVMVVGINLVWNM